MHVLQIPTLSLQFADIRAFWTCSGHNSAVMQRVARGCMVFMWCKSLSLFGVQP